MTTRRRAVLDDFDQGTRTIYSINGVVASVTPYTFRTFGVQETTSSGHPFRSRKRWSKYTPYGHSDLGGAFLTQTAKCIPGKLQVHATDFSVPGNAYRKYIGPMYAWNGNSFFSSFPFTAPSTNAQLDALGSTAIANVLPTNPVAGLGQFLGEMRQLPSSSKVAEWMPTVAKALVHPGKKFKSLKSASKLSKDAASDYLNFQFGWVPFAKDMKEFFNTTRDVDKHLDQYIRDSGKNIRRRYNFPDVNTTTVETYPASQGYGSPILDTQLYVSPGRLTVTTKTHIRRWFSGCFTYYLPKQELQFKLRAYAKIYGLDLTPELIWQIAPWAWATDWIGNFGKVVRNVSAFQRDGLVMRYGYIMETTTRTVEYALTNLVLKGQGPINLTQTYEFVTKVRRKATPYGFGLNPNTFTARQWSIVAALGISKAPRSLNF